MSSFDHLITLIDAARDEAASMGPSAGHVKSRLDEALAEARAMSSRNGRPDEGVRPENLSSANDG